MKKFYMTMAAMLCGVAAMAQGVLTASIVDPETSEKLDRLEIAQGGTAEITVGFSGISTAITAMSFRIGCPAGVSLTTHKETVFNEETFEDEEVDVYDYALTDKVQDHTATIQPIVGEGNEDAKAGFLQVAVTSLTRKVFKGLACDIVTLKLQCDKSAEVGEDFEIILKKAAGATTAAVSVPLEDLKVPVTITKSTGINSINADDENAPIYNVAGQRVSKAQKGVFIQNGKKVAVK